MSQPIKPPADSYYPLVGTVIAAFEAGVRATTDLQRRVATAIPVEPAKSIVSTAADWTRDAGAAVASIARWVLDA